MTVMRVSEKYCPWIDKDLKKLMQTRDKLKKVATKRKSQFLMDSYRQVRNKVNVLNIQLKKQYYTNKISACQGNMKESWKAINELLNKRSKSSNIDCLKESGSETVHKKDISNAMNNFFCSVGKDLSFSFEKVSIENIKNEISELNPSKASTFKNIPPKLLKSQAELVSATLQIIFNNTLEHSTFPDELKLADVSSLLKRR